MWHILQLQSPTSCHANKSKEIVNNKMISNMRAALFSHWPPNGRVFEYMMQISGVRKAEEWKICDQRNWVQNLEVGARTRTIHRSGVCKVWSLCIFQSSVFYPLMGGSVEILPKSCPAGGACNNNTTHWGVLCFHMAAELALPVLAGRWFTTKQKSLLNNVIPGAKWWN